jgi:hypothetical protein
MLVWAPSSREFLAAAKPPGNQQTNVEGCRVRCKGPSAMGSDGWICWIYKEDLATGVKRANHRKSDPRNEPCREVPREIIAFIYSLRD